MLYTAQGTLLNSDTSFTTYGFQSDRMWIKPLSNIIAASTLLSLHFYLFQHLKHNLETTTTVLVTTSNALNVLCDV